MNRKCPRNDYADLQSMPTIVSHKEHQAVIRSLFSFETASCFLVYIVGNMGIVGPGSGVLGYSGFLHNCLELSDIKKSCPRTAFFSSMF